MQSHRNTLFTSRLSLRLVLIHFLAAFGLTGIAVANEANTEQKPIPWWSVKSDQSDTTNTATEGSTDGSAMEGNQDTEKSSETAAEPEESSAEESNPEESTPEAEPVEPAVRKIVSYQVEALLFTNKGNARYEEKPIALDALPVFRPSIDVTVEPLPNDFKIISADQYTLSKQFNRLAKSDRYSPILHMAWEQPKRLEKQHQRIKIAADDIENGLQIDGWMTVYNLNTNDPINNEGKLTIETRLFAIETAPPEGMKPEKTAPATSLEDSNEDQMRLDNNADNNADSGADNAVENNNENNAEITKDAASKVTFNVWPTKTRRTVSNIKRVQFIDNPAFGLLMKIKKIEKEVPIEPSASDSIDSQATMNEKTMNDKTMNEKMVDNNSQGNSNSAPVNNDSAENIDASATQNSME